MNDIGTLLERAIRLAKDARRAGFVVKIDQAFENTNGDSHDHVRVTEIASHKADAGFVDIVVEVEK